MVGLFVCERRARKRKCGCNRSPRRQPRSLEKSRKPHAIATPKTEKTAMKRRFGCRIGNRFAPGVGRHSLRCIMPRAHDLTGDLHRLSQKEAKPASPPEKASVPSPQTEPPESPDAPEPSARRVRERRVSPDYFVWFAGAVLAASLVAQVALLLWVSFG